MKEIKKMVEVTQYQTDDGRIFETQAEAVHHEKIQAGIRKTCFSCNGVGKESLTGDGRDMVTCTTCSGKGWVEKKEVWA